MKSLFLLMVVVLLPTSNVSGQQSSLAFSRAIGIERAQMRSGADTTKRDTTRNVAVHRPSKVPYIAVGSLLGGLAGGVLFADKVADGLRHGGEWMAFPTLGIARYVGGGLVAGGVLGLVFYFIDNR